MYIRNFINGDLCLKTSNNNINDNKNTQFLKRYIKYYFRILRHILLHYVFYFLVLNFIQVKCITLKILYWEKNKFELRVVFIHLLMFRMTHSHRYKGLLIIVIIYKFRILKSYIVDKSI